MSRKDEHRAPAGRTETEERHATPSPARGNTVTAQGETQQPKAQMPHERDESAASQASEDPTARRMGRMAHDDLMEGQQDTSKSQELDATYHEMRKGTDAKPTDKPNRNERGN
ncbi:MAG TPA: hypothetical protein VFM98_01320 [Ramlibacter sp.]|uniref:hypothetical protein n=1 Tax=Ramlibacter sp. TaxID=1917967 RepID=UPI002D80FC2F|nr:hypothetical protein [Ramlibacter sp.]HET8744215.1 hypothetical protein [Ramlibacter sp.]